VTDDEWRMIDHSPNVALTIAWQWSIAVRAQAARVRDGAGVGKIPDAYLLVLAVRNVRRAAKMAMIHFTTHAARDQLCRALADFDAELPGVEAIRNVLEHFDNYAHGTGDMQQDDPMQLCIRIRDHRIDLTKAPGASSRLVHQIRAAAITDRR
jgi:hypothetical protein